MRFELNITLRCNCACPNCNRLCHMKPDWAEDSDMTVADVWRFTSQLKRRNVVANRIKIVGGEPLVHPRFNEVMVSLCIAADAGLINKIKIDTNGTLPRPNIPDHPAVHWSGRRPSKKIHLPTLWSPTDLGLTLRYPCSMPRLCGVSLDNRGYLPCSSAISIVRTFGYDEQYSDSIHGPWDMDKICKHCVFAAPVEWKDRHCLPLTEILEEHKRPTKSWREVLQCSANQQTP
ncbi:MAG: hypothetical protein GY832_24260 [Chloroflexi bacterium]|nr:hypothetical protein [Chloroflexota bacterium]